MAVGQSGHLFHATLSAALSFFARHFMSNAQFECIFPNDEANICSDNENVA